MRAHRILTTGSVALATALLIGGCSLAGPNPQNGAASNPPTGGGGGLTGGGGGSGAGGFNAMPSCTVGPNASGKPQQDASGLSLIDNDGTVNVLLLLYAWCTAEPDEFELEMTLYVETGGSWSVVNSRVAENIPGTIPSSYALQYPCSSGASYYATYSMMLNTNQEPSENLPARKFSTCTA